MSGLTLDAGALIAFDRNDRKLVVLLKRALEFDHSVAVPAGVIVRHGVTVVVKHAWRASSPPPKSKSNRCRTDAIANPVNSAV